MKKSELMVMQPSLMALANIKLPVKVSYRIGKLLGQIARVIKGIQFDQHALYRTIGTLSEDEQQYVIADDRKAEFQAAVTALLDAEVTFEFEPVSLAELGDISIEPGHLAALEGFVLCAESVTPNLRLVE